MLSNRIPPRLTNVADAAEPHSDTGYGTPFVSRSWLERLANTVVPTCKLAPCFLVTP
jgi:hypothetical protein